ncbi:AEC family transporter [Granulosicoccaceae sp. 1_MG-2023]|nr:AEC family transporter [Granulosicoccaceae sp. 1_MG-2023]
MGLAMRRSALVPEEHWRGIELLGYWLLFPALVLESLISMDLSRLNINALVLAYAGALLLYLLIVWSWRRPLARFGISDRSFSSVFQTATRWNGFVALAMAGKFAGDQGMAMVALIMAVTVPLLNVVNVVVLTVCASDTPATPGRTLINTVKVPLIWAALLGLLINLAQVPVYPPLLTSLDMIGRAGLGIGLLTVGAGLRVQAMRSAGPDVLAGIAGKLLLFPLLVFVSCRLAGVQGEAFQVAMLCAAVPTAMNGYVLARQMGGDVALYAATASLQVVVSLLTLPLILWLSVSV